MDDFEACITHLAVGVAPPVRKPNFHKCPKFRDRLSIRTVQVYGPLYICAIDLDWDGDGRSSDRFPQHS